MEGGQDADGGVETGGDIAQGDAGTNRRAVRLAGDAHDAAHALDDDVEGGPEPLRPRLPEAGGGGVDEAGIAGR